MSCDSALVNKHIVVTTSALESCNMSKQLVSNRKTWKRDSRFKRAEGHLQNSCELEANYVVRPKEFLKYNRDFLIFKTKEVQCLDKDNNHTPR